MYVSKSSGLDDITPSGMSIAPATCHWFSLNCLIAISFSTGPGVFPADCKLVRVAQVPNVLNSMSGCHLIISVPTTVGLGRLCSNFCLYFYYSLFSHLFFLLFNPFFFQMYPFLLLYNYDGKETIFFYVHKLFWFLIHHDYNNSDRDNYVFR